MNLLHFTIYASLGLWFFHPELYAQDNRFVGPLATAPQMSVKSEPRPNLATLDETGARNVLKIARGIKVVHPRLKDKKYLEYALGIYRAAIKYQIEPSVLIAITQQETAFRPNLPEGKAGERGICQVLKGWLKNPKFRTEFRNATLADFSEPAKSFQFAAWILADLKKRVKSKTLPYWSYYNANKFHNRFKYFLRVNRYVAALKKNEHLFEDSQISNHEVSRVLAQLEPDEALPPRVLPPLLSTASLVPIRLPMRERLNPEKPQKKQSPPTTLYWIPDAIRQLQLKQKAKQVSVDLSQGQTELAVPLIFGKKTTLQD